ncbi:MAG: hypothetical protein CVV27_04660 [Candidatus Melainabacteria bacterium HGW-Melainabacteria-1]|nr:MAG: hypothetical protein CVV27_04660 [Candidatus Melainabacteria bacterium HGW-Melainabacteria-1]
MRRILPLSLLFLMLSPSALAINVQQMKQRIDNSISGKDQVLAAASEKIICKGDKKPICYAEAVLTDSGFALVKVMRPEDAKAWYILFQQQGKAWKPLHSRTLDKLSLSKFKADHVMIPDPVAKRLIQKMQPLR